MSEHWAMKVKDKPRIPAAIMEFIKRTAKYILMSCKRNEDTLK
jgi:hypothetical protein